MLGFLFITLRIKAIGFPTFWRVLDNELRKGCIKGSIRALEGSWDIVSKYTSTLVDPYSPLLWSWVPDIIGTLRGAGGRGEEDYTSKNRPY